MNIFKILANGDGNIKEPNITEFLAFILDPSKDHGLGAHLLESFLTPIVFKFEEFKFLRKKDIVEVIDLSAMAELYNVEIETEYSIRITSRDITKKSKRRDVDIKILLRKNKKNKNNGDEIYTFLIENKIATSSITDGQLEEWEKGIKQLEENVEEWHDGTTGIIFLTPEKEGRSAIYFGKFKSNYPKYHLSWGKYERNNSDDKETILKMIKDILNKESAGDIEPIHEYTKYTLKAFLNFIISDFKTYSEEKQKIKTPITDPARIFAHLKNILQERNLELLEKIRSYIENEFRDTKIRVMETTNKFDGTKKLSNKRVSFALNNNQVFLQLNIENESLDFYLKKRNDGTWEEYKNFGCSNKGENSVSKTGIREFGAGEKEMIKISYNNAVQRNRRI